MPIPDVTLLAGACTPKATSHVSDRLALVIPFGTCATILRAGGKTYRWASPHHAFFIPAGERIGAESTTGSFVRFDIREAALKRIAAGMLDRPCGKPGIDTSTTRILDMHGPRTNWLTVIRGLCGTVDELDCDAGRLEARLAGPPPRTLDLEPLLEQIRANIGGRVTLADMERWSDRSARTIQLAFQTRCGIGPMQWLRDQRLDLIRDRLLQAPEGATVAAIAKACGIPRLSTLTREYAQRFGERPSETLTRRVR